MHQCSPGIVPQKSSSFRGSSSKVRLLGCELPLTDSNLDIFPSVLYANRVLMPRKPFSQGIIRFLSLYESNVYIKPDDQVVLIFKIDFETTINDWKNEVKLPRNIE